MPLWHATDVTYCSPICSLLPHLLPMASLLVSVVAAGLFLRRGLPVCPWLAWSLLCRPGWPQTHKDLLVPTSRALGLKACTTMSCGQHNLPLFKMNALKTLDWGEYRKAPKFHNPMTRKNPTHDHFGTGLLCAVSQPAFRLSSITSVLG